MTALMAAFRSGLRPAACTAYRFKAEGRTQSRWPNQHRLRGNEDRSRRGFHTGALRELERHRGAVMNERFLAVFNHAHAMRHCFVFFIYHFAPDHRRKWQCRRQAWAISASMAFPTTMSLQSCRPQMYRGRRRLGMIGVGNGWMDAAIAGPDGPLCGPTRIWRMESTVAIEPPPAPISTISITGMESACRFLASDRYAPLQRFWRFWASAAR